MKHIVIVITDLNLMELAGAVALMDNILLAIHAVIVLEMIDFLWALSALYVVRLKEL